MNECAKGPMGLYIFRSKQFMHMRASVESQDLQPETIVVLLSQLPLLEAKREEALQVL